MAEVGSDDAGLAARRADVGKRQVARAGTQVEDWPIASRRHAADSPPAPIMIDPQRQQMIEKIVAAGDFAKHAADASFGFVDGHGTIAKQVVTVSAGRSGSPLPDIGEAFPRESIG